MLLKRAEFSNWKYISKNMVSREELNIDDMMYAVNDFIFNIGKENIVSINEYRQALRRIGDDQKLNIVIFYWDTKS